MRVGRDDFFSMIQKMGFGSRTGIELPAETAGIVRNPAKWNGDSLASMSIGYEIGVTALQIATAFATIANNGIRLQPHIIKEIRKPDEQPNVVTQTTQTQVVSPATARDLKTMLHQVVLAGTGKRAQLNGYTTGGKTGTAWKFNAKSKTIDSSKYVSSFTGMAPLDNPQIVVAVVMDEPKVGARDGGMVSAPVFKEIAQNILQEMKVAPDAPIKPETLEAKKVPEQPEKEVPEVGGTDKKAASASPDAATKPKVTGTPGKKNTPPDPKKTNEKKLNETDKITARSEPGSNRQRPVGENKTKVET